jgi:hypothetical protein
VDNPEKLVDNPEKLVDNPEKLATLGIQVEEKQSKNTTQHVLDVNRHKQT